MTARKLHRAHPNILYQAVLISGPSTVYSQEKCIGWGRGDAEEGEREQDGINEKGPIVGVNFHS